MVFVQREKGAIVAVFANEQGGFANEFLAEDNAEVLAFLTPSVVSVSARQFKLKLLSAGLLDQVDAWVKAQPRAIQIAYEYSGMFVRNEPMMAAGFAAMGFTDQQIDDFFEAASKL